MDTLVPIYMDLFDFQEKAKEMYRSILEDIATFEHHCNVLKTLKEFGYSKPLIESVGGESFTTAIHIGKHELEGKDMLSKKSIYVANLGSWLKDKANYIIQKILDFLRYLMDKITEWFLRPNKQQKMNVNRLMMINAFPPGMQVPNVFNYQMFITRLTALRNLVVYIGDWYTELNRLYVAVAKDPANADAIVIHRLKDFPTARNMFVKEISHNHYRDGVVATSDGCKVIIETASPDPVDPKEFGWNGGSQIRYAETLVSTIMKEIEPVADNMKSLHENISNLRDKWKNSTSEPAITLLLNVTQYVMTSSASLFTGIEQYYVKFYSMTEWIIQEIQKSKR